MPKPTSQTFKKLQKAVHAEDILEAAAQCVREANQNLSATHTPKLHDLQVFSKQVPSAHDVLVLTTETRYKVYTRTQWEKIETYIRSEENFNFFLQDSWNVLRSVLGDPDPELARRASKDAEKEIRKHFASNIFKKDGELPAEDFPIITNFILRTDGEPSAERLEGLHKTWVKAHKKDELLRHPIAPIIKTWMQENLPVVQPERRKDTGILHKALRDSFPSPRWNLHIGEELPTGGAEMLTNLSQGELQMELPGFKFPETELVPALPLVTYEGAGGKSLSKGRGAPIEQRLFINVLLEYQHQVRASWNVSRLGTTYGDIISWLYPNGTNLSKKILIPRLYHGMWRLHNLRFVWDRREWNIISVDALPTMAIKKKDPLTFTIRMPDGMNTKGGPLIGIEPLRIYGAQSAPKFRAWVRLAYLWDTAKLRNGGYRVYATVPEVLRNSEDYIVDSKGQVILTGDIYRTNSGWKFRQGNIPQQAWYHPLAVQTGQTVRNPQAEKVPVLNDSDMVKLFFDHTKRKGTTHFKALHDAKKHARKMHEEGKIVVEQDQMDTRTGIRGWRILEPYKW